MKVMKANDRFCFLASVAIFLSLSLAGETFAQEHSVELPRPAASAPLRAAISADCAFFAVVTADGRLVRASEDR